MDSHKKNVGEEEQPEGNSTALYVGKLTDKVIKAIKKHDVNVGIRNKRAMVKRISNNQTENRKRWTKEETTRSIIVDNVLEKSEKSSVPG